MQQQNKSFFEIFYALKKWLCNRENKKFFKKGVDFSALVCYTVSHSF